MSDIYQVIVSDNVQEIIIQEDNTQVLLQSDSIQVVSIAEQGPVGPAGANGTSGTTNASLIPIVLPSGTTDLQTAITDLATQFFQQTTAPTGTGVNDGDLWFDTVNQILKVMESGVWTQVTVTPDLSTASINGGYF